MRIKVDATKCIGAGLCVVAAPEVFSQNEDDGLVIVLQEDRAPSGEEENRRNATDRSGGKKSYCHKLIVSLDSAPDAAGRAQRSCNRRTVSLARRNDRCQEMAIDRLAIRLGIRQ